MIKKYFRSKNIFDNETLWHISKLPILCIFAKFIDLQCPWNLFWSRKMESIQSFDAFWLKNWPFSNFVSLWHINKLPILGIFRHFLENLLTYSVNDTFFDLEKWKVFKAWMHFDWKIDSFQILRHFDISVNCAFYSFLDTFWKICWLTVSMKPFLI